MERGFLTAALLSFGIGAMAQGVHSEDVRIGFKVSSSVVMPTFGDNEKALKRIMDLLREVQADTTRTLVELRLCGYASPEGEKQYNKRLATARRDAMEKYIRGRIEVPDSVICREESDIAWNQLAQVMKTSDMPHADEVLAIIADAPANGAQDTRKDRLMKLRGGTVWNDMLKLYFPSLRGATSVVIRYKDKYPERPKPVVVDSEPRPTAVQTRAVVPEAPASKRPLYFSVGTNMLYDVLTVPNIHAEVYMGHDISVAAGWMYSWWKSDNHSRYWRTYGGNLAVRYWMGEAAKRKPLTGHHLGVYGQMLTYDLELGGRGYLGDKWSYAAGVEYGFALPVASRLNIDFVLGVGYMGGKYKEYLPIDGHYVWQCTKQRHWVGPTNAAVSLVWLLGPGNVNTKKRR